MSKKQEMIFLALIAAAAISPIIYAIMVKRIGGWRVSMTVSWLILLIAIVVLYKLGRRISSSQLP